MRAYAQQALRDRSYVCRACLGSGGGLLTAAARGLVVDQHSFLVDRFRLAAVAGVCPAEKRLPLREKSGRRCVSVGLFDQ